MKLLNIQQKCPFFMNQKKNMTGIHTHLSDSRISITEYFSGKKNGEHKSYIILFLKTQPKLPLALQDMKCE